MATFNKGTPGGFSGTAGTVIGSNWKGRTVMRSLPVKKSKAASQFQLDQQEKFRLAVAFLSGMADLLKITFRAFATKVSGFNAAVSYNIQKAITGAGSPFSIEYEMAPVSLGFSFSAVSRRGLRLEKYTSSPNQINMRKTYKLRSEEDLFGMGCSSY